ncbi:MAG: hypothetical protein BWY66_00132 [bacterium ADurb.Bin374]|nr:MAG: hypothetical protein BWY66_00132 [bacterium ADurb.Bin374]
MASRPGTATASRTDQAEAWVISESTQSYSPERRKELQTSHFAARFMPTGALQFGQ